jgi:site-specific DNA-methyltransferase (adenine-specific)
MYAKELRAVERVLRGGLPGAVLCADSMKLLPLLEARSIDFVFTDPSYGHSNNNNGDLTSRREAALGRGKPGPPRPIANDGYEADLQVRFALHEFRRLLKGGCCCCCCCGGGGPDPQFARWSLWLDEAIGFKQMVVWDKGGLGLGWHYRRNYETVLVGQIPGGKARWYGGHKQANVIRIPKIIPTAADHPTPKPEELVELFLRCHTRPGDVVLDPFAGGGTTGVACKRMRRRYILTEIDPYWARRARKRIEDA